jgi:hypothetical protein
MPMNLRSFRSFGLLLALASAGTAPFLVNCAGPDEYEDEESEGALTGVDNKLGLGLAYDAKAGSVTATLKDSLKPGEQLRIRVRRGKPELGDEAKLDCNEISEARPITGAGSRENAPVRSGRDARRRRLDDPAHAERPARHQVRRRR